MCWDSPLTLQPEVGRTIVYSYTLFRPILAPALILLVNLEAVASASSSLISASHVQDALTSTMEMISQARPVDWDGEGTMIGQIVERGKGRVGGEAGRDLWRKFLG